MNGCIERDGHAVAAVRERVDRGPASAVARCSRELRVHCYRMLGSFREAEAVTKETLERAEALDRPRGGAELRFWLYRTATEGCLETIARQDWARLVTDPVQKADGEALPDLAEVSWLEPYPDSLLDPPPNGAASPEPPSVARDAIELAFVAALQLLSPGQRSALVLHDVLGWSEEAAARLLDLGLPALRDALHRARRALRYHPPRPAAWPSGIDAEETEKQLVRTYIHANERSDVASFESVIRRDATFRVPHDPGATVGRDTILRLWMEGGLGSSEFGRLRCVVTRANRQPAIAAYVMRPGTTAYRAQGMEVLRVEDGTISEIVAFPPDVFAAFGLPLVL